MNTAILCSIGPDKPLEVATAVIESFVGQQADQVVVVLDRPSGEMQFAVERALRDGHIPCPLDKQTVIVLEGDPGWRSPCIAFNAGLAAICPSDDRHMTVITHGDVELQPRALETARTAMLAHEAVYFANVSESNPERLIGNGHAGPVLMNWHNPRALTYLFATPTKALKAIGGWDEDYQKGVCYEDDDLTTRLWKHGLDFAWLDSFRGIHNSHSRKYFTPMRIAPNQALFLEKHGTLEYWRKQMLLGNIHAIMRPYCTTWTHPVKEDASV